MNLLLKIALSAALIGAISEISRRNGAVAALLAALPLVSLISILWMRHDGVPTAQIAAFSWSVFWYVLPSLLFFVLFPVLLTRVQMPFFAALALAAAATVAAFFLLKLALSRFGVEL